VPERGTFLMDTTFRSAPTPVVQAPKVNVPEPEPNKTGVESNEKDIEPLEIRETRDGDIVLEALGIEDKSEVMPGEDKANLSEVKDYVKEIVKDKGLPPTVGSFKKVIDSLKGEMGMDEEADPQLVLDRIAGVVKAWRNLSFLRDPIEKKRIFMRLANLKSSSDMNREVFKVMSQNHVWI
jgi:hypothetical protein